jgi:hypothetical protein
MKAFILSQPKSGTYLAANLLRELGFDHRGLHLTPTPYYYEYDLSDPHCMDKDKFQTYKKRGKNFESNVKLIPNNSFAVGHIPMMIPFQKALDKFKRILVTRSSHGVKDSAVRFKEDYNRKINVQELLRERIAEWEPYCFHLTFEDMVDRNYDKVDDLQTYLFGKVKFHSQEVLKSALYSDSPTKSSIRRNEGKKKK